MLILNKIGQTVSGQLGLIDIQHVDRLLVKNFFFLIQGNTKQVYPKSLKKLM